MVAGLAGECQWPKGGACGSVPQLPSRAQGWPGSGRGWRLPKSRLDSSRAQTVL